MAKFTPGDTHMLRHVCRPNGLLFHQKPVDMGPILVKKSLEEGPSEQKLQKLVKLVVFEAEKPLQMGLNLRNFLFCFLFFIFIFFFLVRKFLDIG